MAQEETRPRTCSCKCRQPHAGRHLAYPDFTTNQLTGYPIWFPRSPVGNRQGKRILEVSLTTEVPCVHMLCVARVRTSPAPPRRRILFSSACPTLFPHCRRGHPSYSLAGPSSAEGRDAAGRSSVPNGVRPSICTLSSWCEAPSSFNPPPTRPVMASYYVCWIFA